MNAIATFLRKIISPLKNAFRALPRPVRYYINGWWRKPPWDEFFTNTKKQQTIEQLRKQQAASTAQTIWFLPTVAWYSAAFQRPQQMARALAESGATVVYFEPWIWHEPRICREQINSRRFKGLRVTKEGVTLLRCPEEDYRDILETISPDAVMAYWPAQDEYLPASFSKRLIYENVDDHSLYPSVSEAWKQTHGKWLRDAAVVTTTADQIYEQIQPLQPDALLLPNAVRLQDWRDVPEKPVPEDLAPALKHQLVIGYHGALAQWFDWQLLKQAATLKSDWAFVLIGFAYHYDFQKIMDDITSSCPNVYFLGQKPYEVLPHYLRHFEVATIPFLINELTDSCSPVKLFEYFAMGKPVVATSMREIQKYSPVLFASNANEFVAQIEKAAQLAHDETYLAQMAEIAEANTWKARAKVLLEHLPNKEQRS